MMNVQLIKKLIESNNETCPELTYSNPLLDNNVTSALSRSFVKVLNILEKNPNRNNKSRNAVLENIRKMCKIEPDEHIKVDENLTELLTSYYEKQIQETNHPDTVDATDKKLDAFLIRRSKEININSSFQSTLSPEVIQALINLNEKNKYNDALIQDVIHWNQDDTKYLKLLKEMWQCSKKDDIYENKCNLSNDISIKIKTEIEKSLIDITYNLLCNDAADSGEILNNNNYKTLIETCSVSSECYQICINVLNTLFLMNNYHTKIQNLIVAFVQKVKLACSKETFAILYPTYLTHLVVLLDVDFSVLSSSLKLHYIERTISYLKILHKKSASDLILLLSHFPHWEIIYFEQ